MKHCCKSRSNSRQHHHHHQRRGERILALWADSPLGSANAHLNGSICLCYVVLRSTVGSMAFCSVLFARCSQVSLCVNFRMLYSVCAVCLTDYDSAQERQRGRSHCSAAHSRKQSVTLVRPTYYTVGAHNYRIASAAYQARVYRQPRQRASVEQ